MQHDFIYRKAHNTVTVVFYQKPHFIRKHIGGHIHFVTAVKIKQISTRSLFAH